MNIIYMHIEIKLTEISMLSLVIPCNVIFNGFLANGAKTIKGSKKYPMALEFPQSKFIFPPLIIPGL